jgi:hypothetical protein
MEERFQGHLGNHYANLNEFVLHIDNYMYIKTAGLKLGL